MFKKTAALIVLFCAGLFMFVHSSLALNNCTEQDIEKIYNSAASGLTENIQNVDTNSVISFFSSIASNNNCSLSSEQTQFFYKAIDQAKNSNLAILPKVVTPIDFNNPHFYTEQVVTNTPAPVTVGKTVNQSSNLQTAGTCGGQLDEQGNAKDPQFCCNSHLGLNPDAQIDEATQHTFCVNILWGQICLSDMMKNISNGLQNMLFSKINGDNGREGGGLNDLSNLLGTCNNGFVRQLQSDPNDPNKAICNCVPGATAEQLSIKFCSTYIASAKGVKTEADFEKDPEVKSCINCFSGGGYWSSIGCIQLNSFQDFIQKNLFGWGLSIAAIIALGCIAYGAIRMQLSQGNAEQVKKAQEMLTSCIIGFILIIFSIFILRLLGVTILQIPGFK